MYRAVVEKVLPAGILVKEETPSTLKRPLVVWNSCGVMTIPKNGGNVVALKTGSAGVPITAEKRVKRRARSCEVAVPGVTPDCAVKVKTGKATVWPGKIEATLVECSKAPVGKVRPFAMIVNGSGVLSVI